MRFWTGSLRRMGERRGTQSVRGGGTKGGRDTVRRSGRDAEELLGGGWRKAPSLISGGECTATKDCLPSGCKCVVQFILTSSPTRLAAAGKRWGWGIECADCMRGAGRRVVRGRACWWRMESGLKIFLVFDERVFFTPAAAGRSRADFFLWGGARVSGV